MKQVKIIQVGLGPLGQKIVSYAVRRDGIEVIAAVDSAPDKADKDLHKLCHLDKELGITVLPDVNAAIEKNKPEVALLATVSSLEKIVPQIEEIVKHGINVVSTCEELTFPWTKEPELSKKLDEMAKRYNVAILGTGVNPGFLMDFLPIVFTGVCQEVKNIKVSRIQDASIRRVPFQKKIGAGLTLDEFEKKKQSGTLRHVGLTESMHMIASRMGWHLDETEDTLTPVIAKFDIITEGIKIVTGMAAGVQQIGKGYVNGENKIILEFRASIGEKNPGDTIEIKGEPDITSTIAGGINGDIATCAIIINAVRSVMDVVPGLKTMADVPVLSFFEDCVG